MDLALFVVWLCQDLRKEEMLMRVQIGREVLMIEGVDEAGPPFRLTLNGTRLLVDSLIYRGYSYDCVYPGLCNEPGHDPECTFQIELQ